MSAQSLGALPVGVPAGELAIVQRVQQLQALIESARAVSSGGVLGDTATGSSGAAQAADGTDFAAALQAATTADAAAGTQPASAVYAPELAGTANVADAADLAGTAGVDDTAGLAGDLATAAQEGAAGEGDDYEALVDQAAARNGVDPAVLHGLIQQESGFDPSATSSAGAMGLTQLMPATASTLGVANPFDPAESIEGGARYLGELLRQFAGNTEDALAAYNAGPGAVQEYGGIPPYPETQNYVSSVLGYAESYRQSHPATATGELL